MKGTLSRCLKPLAFSILVYCHRGRGEGEREREGGGRGEGERERVRERVGIEGEYRGSEDTR